MSIKARIEDFKSQVANAPVVNQGIRLLQAIKIPKANTNLYDLSKTVLKEWRRVDVDTNASAISFRFLMALPPLMLFFFTLLPYLPLQGYVENIYFILNLIFPEGDEANIVYEFINEFISTPRTGLLSISIVVTFIISSNGIFKMLQIFDKYLRVNVKETTRLKRRLKAMQMLIMLLVIYIMLLTLEVGQNELFQWIVDKFGWSESVSSSFLYITTYLLLIGVLIISIAILYYFGPSVNQKWRFFSTGVYIAATGVLLFTIILSFIASTIVDYNQIYGSVGTLFLVMIWMYINSKILLSGFLVNMSLDHYRYPYINEDEEYY